MSADSPAMRCLEGTEADLLESADDSGAIRPARRRPDGAPNARQVHRPMTALAGRALIDTTARVPLRGLHAFARGAVHVAGALRLKESKVTRVNLSLCFPELSEPERRRLARESLEEAACMVTELGHFWRRPVEEVLSRVVEVRGEEHLLRGLERGRGVVVAGPHMGAWELLGLWMGARYSITSLYLKPRVRELEQVYREARGRSGARLQPTDASGMRAVCQALRRGGVVGVLPDQDPGPCRGVFVPFFGVPANSSTVVPRIAARLRSTVVLAFAERLPRAAGYRIRIQPGSAAIADGDLETGTSALSRDVERLVRVAPRQYLWSYKRFRTRPPGSPNLYSSPVRPDPRAT